jgi:acyl-lipid omega-6 desaturase (Delta-12 desaturase)
MSKASLAPKKPETKKDWYELTSRYARPDVRKTAWQILNTFPLYFGLWALMLYTIRNGYSYALTLILALAASAPLMRIFIFFHDCCHGSFFPSRRANRIMGYVSGILTFTPFEAYQRSHAEHHFTLGDLDRRGVSHIWLMTVDEYLAAPLRTRLMYRLFRNPVLFYSLGPIIKFFIENRFFLGSGKITHKSVMLTNLILLTIFVVAGLTIGLRTYLLIQVPIVAIAGALGFWLFFIQHQYEGAYFARHEEWDPLKAALEGSSYYQLPKMLQWITGNIGFHHVHHLNPNIPNYHLPECYAGIPALQTVKPLTILRSLKSLRLHLWDERQRKLVTFDSLREIPQAFP